MIHSWCGKENRIGMLSMKSKVVFAEGKVKESFKKLSRMGNEKSHLLKWLNQAFDRLSEDAFSGIQIPKRQIPKRYIEKFGIDNLWKLNLPQGWRLLYSVARDEILIISIILEWLPHKIYEKRFKY